VLAVLATFFVSVTPLLELRVGIPLGVGLGLSTLTATLIATTANILQIPIAIKIVDLLYRYFQKNRWVGRWLSKTEANTLRFESWIHKWGWLGLTGFVIIPLPGTGAWGGAVLSRLLRIPYVGSLIGLAVGVALTGVVFGLGTHGVVSLIRFFR